MRVFKYMLLTSILTENLRKVSEANVDSENSSGKPQEAQPIIVDSPQKSIESSPNKKNLKSIKFFENELSLTPIINYDDVKM